MTSSLSRSPCWPGGAKIAIQIVLNYEEGSEVTPVNGDPHSESVATELGPGVQKMQGERNVNVESLYEVSVTEGKNA